MNVRVDVDRCRSLASFATGDVVAVISGHIDAEGPSWRTLQVDRQRHITGLGPLGWLNHSCDPNLALNTADLGVVALGPIEEGDELTLFYPATEWDMARPFPCQCGAPGCLQIIGGARYLSDEVLLRYALAPHVAARMAERRTEGGRVEELPAL